MDKKDRWDEINAIFAKVYEARRFEKLRKEMEEFEDGFPDGVYVAPSSCNEPRIKLKEMYGYCLEKGIDPNGLTEEEREKFLVYPNDDKKNSR
ncbi:TPA: hypothetical protein ACGXMZ_006009 [Bacillus albus]